MAQVIYAESSPTVGTTEYSFANGSTTLATKTEKGVYALALDCNAVVAGDQFLVQVYETARSAAGTKRLLESWLIEGPPGKPILYLPSTGGIMLGNGWDWTIKKLAGTDRAIPGTLWRVEDA